MTEKEFFNGILKANNVADNAIVFLREIDETDNIIEVNPQLAATYMELDGNSKIDKETSKHLNALKSKVKKILPKNNLHEFKVNIKSIL